MFTLSSVPLTQLFLTQTKGGETAKQVQSRRKTPEVVRESEETHESGTEEESHSQSTLGGEGEEEDLHEKRPLAVESTGKRKRAASPVSDQGSGGPGEEEDSEQDFER